MPPTHGGNNICLQCKKHPKRQNFTFCSKNCSDAAARAAPKLINIPSNHVMYQDGMWSTFSSYRAVTLILAVKQSFESSWNAQGKPTILNVYLITWSVSLRSSFDKYRYLALQ